MRSHSAATHQNAYLHMPICNEGLWNACAKITPSSLAASMPPVTHAPTCHADFVPVHTLSTPPPSPAAQLRDRFPKAAKHSKA